MHQTHEINERNRQNSYNIISNIIFLEDFDGLIKIVTD